MMMAGNGVIENAATLDLFAKVRSEAFIGCRAIKLKLYARDIFLR
jgi:hypothetical protein